MMKKYGFAFLAIFGFVLFFSFVSAEKSFGQLRDSDLFGSAVADIGDLDGDGFSDLVVGAPYDDDGGIDRGAVWILFLNADGSVKDRKKVSSTTTVFSGQLANYDRFGWSVSGVGDLDGDGFSDLVVGAPYTPDGGTNKGAVFVLFLNSDASVKSARRVSALTEPLLAAELGVGDFFGSSVFGIEDLDGDSIPELVVGATYDDDGGTDRGAIYILFLNADGTIKKIEKISNTAGVGTKPVLDNGDLFGSAVSVVGDLDGDSVPELVVGAAYDDDGGTDRGAVYVFFLNADASIKNFAKVSSGNGVDLKNSDLFGYSVSSVGDLDGDGIKDIVVGAFGDGDGGAYRGAVWILFLNADGSVKDRKKISSTMGNFFGQLDNGDRFGSSVFGIEDLDGDSIPELVVGATYDDDGGTDRGTVYVLFLEETANSTGDFVSRVFDAGSSVSFSVLQWTPFFPYGEEQSSSDSGLVGLWHFNQKNAGNEVQDASGNGNIGVLMNGADVSASGLFETKALFLDGVNDSASVANAASLNPSAITVEAWIKTSGTNDYSGIVDKFVGTGYQINVDNLGRARLDIGGSPYSTVVGTTNLETGEWFHVAGTYDGSMMRVFVNGVQENSLAYAGGITSSGQPLLVGNDSETGGRLFSGSIDEVAVFNRALSASEILGHYRRGVLRLKLQARSCNDSACSGETFVGSDGTSSSFFPNASQSWDLGFLPSNRFFQYKAFFETTDPKIAFVDPDVLKLEEVRTNYGSNQSFTDTTKTDFDAGAFNLTKSNSPGDVQLFFDLSKNVSNGKVSKFKKISHTKGGFTVEILKGFSKITGIGQGGCGRQCWYRVLIAVLGDVDKDGIPDIAAPNPAPSTGFTVFFLTSIGEVKSTVVNGGAMSLAIDQLADYDGDGVNEIITGQFYLGNSTNIVFLDQDGKIKKTNYVGGAGYNVIGGLGDLTGDGVVDGYTVGRTTSWPFVARYYRVTMNADGTPQRTDLTGDPRKGVKLWDIDEDGITDNATARNGNIYFQFMDASGNVKTEYFFPSLGSGFGDSCWNNITGAAGDPTFYSCQEPIDILGDIDQDGITDIIVPAASALSAYILNLQNIPPGPFGQCNNDCTVDGAIQCIDSSTPQQCNLVGTCLEWQDLPVCSANQSCQDGTGCVCNNECSVGDSGCVAGIPRSCQQAADGCWVWVNGVPVCSVGDTSCSSDGKPRACVVDPVSSCAEWQEQTPVCNAGEKQCSGPQPQECIIGGSGCLEWVDFGSVCALPFVCFLGNCVNAQQLFSMRVFPVPLIEGQQLKVELEIVSSSVKTYDVELVVNKTLGGRNIFDLSKNGIVVDPAVSPSAVVGFYGYPQDPDFDTTGLVAGNYSVTLKAIDNATGELAFENTVFIAVIPELQAYAIPELHPLLSIIVALTVFITVLWKSRK